MEYRVVKIAEEFHLYEIELYKDDSFKILHDRPIWSAYSVKEIQEALRELLRSTTKPVMDWSKREKRIG